MKIYLKILTRAYYYRKMQAFRRKLQIWSLLHSENAYTRFIPLWKLNDSKPESISYKSDNCEINIFGTSIPRENIVWNMDYVNGHVFANSRFDKIKAEKLFNRGIDVKFPWELSRSTFLLLLANQYIVTRDAELYEDFKKHIVDWINSNPFLYGINWKCTMDVALRGMVWCISGSAFYDRIEQDDDFLRTISMSLIDHAEYINRFPEKYEKRHSTNHTTADYVGLLYLSLCLPEHYKSQKWQNNAIQGIISCMNYQVNDEGFAFEASIGYHRLVTELFALAYIVCKSRRIDLTPMFTIKLFKMFCLVADLIQPDGTVPLFGDNDSSTLLQPDFSQNNKYTYLISLGRLIFDHDFHSNYRKNETHEFHFLPQIEKESILISAINNSAFNGNYKESGIFILKNSTFHSCIGLLPLGQKGRGSHNHLDYGSFTLAIQESTCIVDPGTYTYTRDYYIRNKFKSYFYHNVLIPHDHVEILDNINTFKTLPYYKSKSIDIQDNCIEIEYFLAHSKSIFRKFSLIDNGMLVENSYPEEYILKLHFSPFMKKPDIFGHLLVFDTFNIELKHITECKLEDYYYSPAYGVQFPAICAILKSSDYSAIAFKLKMV